MSENNNKVSIIKKLNDTPVSKIAEIKEVADRFQNLYQIMNGGNSKIAATKYESEKFHFAKLLKGNAILQQCTKLSLYGCFLDMAVNGLSFDPSMKHAYVVSFNANVGTKQTPKWEKRATLMISGYGELSMRVQQKQIKYADNPILVYEGDHFVHGTKDGKVYLEHVAAFPRKTDNIIACYIRLERNDGSYDYKVLSIEEVMKLRAFSKDPTSKAWTDGLPGMIQAKTIKHAFKSYPKMKLGQFSQLQSEVIESENDDMVIDYGIEDDAVEVETEVIEEATEVVEDHSFAKKSNNKAATVSFDDDNF